MHFGYIQMTSITTQELVGMLIPPGVRRQGFEFDRVIRYQPSSLSESEQPV